MKTEKKLEIEFILLMSRESNSYFVFPVGFVFVLLTQSLTLSSSDLRLTAILLLLSTEDWDFNLGGVLLGLGFCLFD